MCIQVILYFKGNLLMLHLGQDKTVFWVNHELLLKWIICWWHRLKYKIFRSTFPSKTTSPKGTSWIIDRKSGHGLSCFWCRARLRLAWCWIASDVELDYGIRQLRQPKPGSCQIPSRLSDTGA
jgi:hypothetical protein